MSLAELPPIKGNKRLDVLLEKCAGLSPIVTGVVYPTSVEALTGALDAFSAGLITPVLYGPKAVLGRLAEIAGRRLAGLCVVKAVSAEDSARKAAVAAGAGELQALMKGSLHSDVFLHAIMQKDIDLRTLGC